MPLGLEDIQRVAVNVHRNQPVGRLHHDPGPRSIEFALARLHAAAVLKIDSVLCWLDDMPSWWKYGRVKTTIELPDATLRRAKILAAARGVTLKRFFIEALEEQLRRCSGELDSRTLEAPWMDGFGRLVRPVGRKPLHPSRHRTGVRDARPRRPHMILDTNAVSA